MADFGSRGSELWRRLGQDSEFTPAGVLAVEACRTADRLEGLDRQLSGDELLRVESDRQGDLVLMVDKALIEARLQASALKALLESPLLKVAAEGADPLDEFTREREARRAAASGSYGA